jgi:hypothetical protein
LQPSWDSLNNLGLYTRNGKDLSIEFHHVLKFCHKEGEEVDGGGDGGVKRGTAGFLVWFLRKTERSVVESRPRVLFLGGLRGGAGRE